MATEEQEQNATPAQDETKDVAPDNEQAAPQPETPATSDDSATPAAPDANNGVQRRIDELTRHWRTTERDRDYWRELALKGQQPPQQPPAQPSRPKADDFESYDEYIEALTDYKVGERAKQWQEQQRAQQGQQAQAQRQQAFQAKAHEFTQQHPDFWEVAGNPAVPISQTVVDVAIESDIGPQVLYHLGKNPQEAARLAQLSPTAVAREIGRLEARLQLPPKKTSQAPEPIQPIGGGGEQATKDPSKMTMDEFVAWRRQSLKR